MKGIHASKIFLFINLLCLKWLPNYCDIKQNEADSQGIQIHKVVSNDPTGIKNVPSKQEKESFHGDIENKKLLVEPNVEYVNSIENKEAKVNSEEVRSFKSPQHDQTPEEVTQTIVANLESSRSSSIEAKDETSVLSKRSEKNSAEPYSEIIDQQAKKPDQLEPEPSLSAPDIEPSLAKQSLDKTHKSIGATPRSPVVESVGLDIPVKKEEVAKLPYQIPLNPESEKHLLESIHQQPHYDGMPSFDEWKKMMLAEQEKGGQKMPSPTPPGKKISSQKRRRNYSSYECGAKIVASNAESEGTGRILNELVDEYMLNPCKAKIWFVIELCETVQATQIELANFELFSSCPKDFAVYSSDNFPTRDWVLLGTFNAAEQRVLQSFELKQEGFGKFIKIELLSYYGKEHYCPLSVVRIFGTSMVDEYEEMETLASHPNIPDDDLDRLDISLEDKKTTNIFNSATDAVMNIVKKAAQALGQHQSLEDGSNNETTTDQPNISEAKLCKIIDNSSNKCEEVPINSKKDSLLPLLNFSVSPSSKHHSLFRLLHRCDQCVSSRIRYYSSAQPHCRFFQAAFGPVVFQGLCDWFKEHPLVFAHESSAHRKDIPPQSDPLIVSPTKSPPPQIIIVPLENDTSLKKLQVSTNISSISESENNDIINVTKTNFDGITTSETASEKNHLEPSIQPTHSVQNDHTVVVNDSKKAIPIAEFSETALPSADTIQELPKRPIIVPEEADLLTDNTVTETVSIDTVTDPPPLSEVFPDADEEQMKEFISDAVVMSEDPLSDIVAATEFPPSLKLNEEKIQDMRSELQGKLDPVPVSSVATAGQKESVFMRMSNRIKSLELNMSLSSQYLQELSQRYRRQMEDMQRAFNRTIGTLNDTAKKAAERDLRQQDILNTLQLQVANLSQTVEILLNERSSVFREMIETHVCLMVIEAIIMITVMSLCVRRISSSAGQIPQVVRELPMASPRLSKRRSSVDSCSTPVARKVKKRSASEEVLNAGEEMLIIEPLPVFLEPIKAKKKNRKRSRVQRSVSNPSVQRRNSSPTSQYTTKLKSQSEGCMLKNVRAKHQLHRKNHPCENCNDNTCTEVKATSRERKLNGAPFQNLTNGTAYGSQDPSIKSQRLLKGRERFSFRKFLKFQKRDSI